MTRNGVLGAFDDAGDTLLSAIARYLGLAPDWFDPAVKDGNSVLRLLHYPPVSPEAPGVRAGAHEDINLITLLLGAEEGRRKVAEIRASLSDDHRPRLSDLLDKYADHGDAQFEIPEIFDVDPLAGYGTFDEIAREFGGPEHLGKAVRDLQNLLYQEAR